MVSRAPSITWASKPSTSILMNPTSPRSRLSRRRTCVRISTQPRRVRAVDASVPPCFRGRPRRPSVHPEHRLAVALAQRERMDREPGVPQARKPRDQRRIGFERMDCRPQAKQGLGVCPLVGADIQRDTVSRHQEGQESEFRLQAQEPAADMRQVPAGRHQVVFQAVFEVHAAARVSRRPHRTGAAYPCARPWRQTLAPDLCVRPGRGPDRGRR